MKLRDDIRYPASLLDADNQQLASGEVLLRPEKGYGNFWPHLPIDEDLILKSAKILQVSGEARLAVQSIHRCPDCAPRHFEFDYTEL